MNSTKSKYVGLLYIAPALLFVVAFTLYPLGQLFWMSLHNWSLLGGSRFSGFGNYVRAYEDPIFWSALFFTFEYTLYLTPILMIPWLFVRAVDLRHVALGQTDAGHHFHSRCYRPRQFQSSMGLAIPAPDRSFQ